MAQRFPPPENLIAEFDATPGAWRMQFEDGGYAYLDDESPLGPFETEREAAEAAASAGWIKASPNAAD